MQYAIENQYLDIRVKSLGAELCSLYDKEAQQELLWQADAAFWPRHAPVLFPVVGKLKNDQYRYRDQWYTMGQHGFARDKTFTLFRQEEHKLIFRLTDDEVTRKVYPFAFQLDIVYELRGKELITSYWVENPAHEDLYFSIGAHPAFRVPLLPGESLEDYELEFNQEEDAPVYLIREGLISEETLPVFRDRKRLALNEAMFERDALVFKGLRSEDITMKKRGTATGMQFIFPDFPFFGIWKKPGAAFICLEPWCGIADGTAHNQELTRKEGIVRLEAGGTFSRSFSVISKE